ncbi:WYL domain-containing protein [Bacillus sp. AFS055030]|uniref:helix-turn-helix transcriptional regulator n=1 Tax=Bacillus sp. AFS055030 TaxID=2033507 RepID=UPI000BFC0E7C|nr:WYL domain-containing protein [Bacillus sp. AFS055030]PGL72599.1 WYL domain-containing protein [Bacillus sp. AFS055030]
MENRERFYKLMKLLESKTDIDHEFTFDEIKKRLAAGEEDFSYSKNTFLKDISVLVDVGFDVIENASDGKATTYSHQERLFELHELRLLVDAVTASRFLNKQETKKIIDKLKKLTSENEAKKLHNGIIPDTAIKSESNRIHFSIDQIHQAIAEKKLLTFQYGRYNFNKKFELSHDGKEYTVKPLAVIWSNDYYYLITRNLPDDQLRHFRVDRMRKVKKTEEKFQDERFNVDEYLSTVFNMFAGEPDYVKIKFKKGLLNVVLDRFGLKANIQQVDEDHFILTTKAAISDGLITWILTWGKDAQVISPPSVIEKVQEQIFEMSKLYSMNLQQ